MTNRALVWMLLFAFALAPALAGCIGSGEDDVEPASGAAPKAKVSSTTGAVAGVVTTQAVEPIADARVTLLETNQSAKTDKTGAFVVNDVKPGEYTITVVHPGFKATTRRAAVMANEVVRVEFALTPADATDPYVVQEQFDGYAACAFDAVVLTGTGFCDDPNNNVEYYTRADVDLRSIVGEMKWDSQDRLSFSIGEHPDPEGNPSGLNKRAYGEVVSAQAGENYLRMHLKTGVWNNETGAEIMMPPPNATYEFGTRTFYRGAGDKEIQQAYATAVSPVCGSVPVRCSIGFFGVGFAPALKYTIYLTSFYIEAGPEEYSVLSANGG